MSSFYSNCGFDKLTRVSEWSNRHRHISMHFESSSLPVRWQSWPKKIDLISRPSKVSSHSDKLRELAFKNWNRIFQRYIKHKWFFLLFLQGSVLKTYIYNLYIKLSNYFHHIETEVIRMPVLCFYVCTPTKASFFICRVRIKTELTRQSHLCKKILRKEISPFSIFETLSSSPSTSLMLGLLGCTAHSRQKEFRNRSANVRRSNSRTSQLTNMARA